MIKIITSAEIDSEQWQGLVENSPYSSFFQTRSCYDLYCKSTFLAPILIGISENDKLVGLICGYKISNGGLIKKFLSRRIIVPGGILLDKNISSQALNTLLQYFKSYASKISNYVEIRNFCDYSNYNNEIENAGFTYHSHFNFHLKTTDTEAVLKRFSVSKRRQINVSEKAGVICELSKNHADISSFYKILSNLHLNKIKTPLFPLSFFENLVNEDFAKFFVVKKGNEVLGGIVCVTLNNKVIYEWFVCGKDEDEKKTNIYPSVYATYSAIKYACENKYQYFDFMGAGKPGISYGVREFKSKFGGELVDHGRYLFVINPVIYYSAKLYLSFKSQHFTNSKKSYSEITA